MRRPKSNILDASTANFLEPRLKSLRKDFKASQRVDERSKQSLWALLGDIYELDQEISNNEVARARLIESVKQLPDVRGDNRWQPDKRRPRELLLVLLLGLSSKTKARKSQWLSAFKSAERAKVRASKEDFASWMSDVGGVDGARKLVVERRPLPTIDELAADIDDFIDQESTPISLPNLLTDGPFPKGYGLVLVKQGDSSHEGIPLFTVANGALVKNALQRVLSEIRKSEAKQRASYESELKQEQSARKKGVRQRYQKAKADGRFAGEFEEFLFEWENEHLSPEEEWTRITDRP